MVRISAFVLLMIAVLMGCSSGGKSSSSGKRGAMKFPVEVMAVTSRDVDLVIHAIGSVEAFEIVPVTARVPGVVQKVGFREGEKVKSGDPLIEIEPERYNLALQSAQAAFDKACASLQEARARLSRRVDIQGKNPGFVSPEDLENWQTRYLSYAADSAQALANLNIARLNLRDAYVPAPVSGIIQSRSVLTGQYVQAGTVIATMVRRDPLLLRFSVIEGDAQRLRAGQQVMFTVRDDHDIHTGVITAVAESADPVTRMVTITAEVNDPQRDRLRPGTFAEVTVLLGETEKLPVIPQTCIRPSERGFLAYVVSDSTARERVLKLGLQTQEGSVEVRDGIQDGELVVVRGAEALRDGVPVRIMQSDSANVEANQAGRQP
ncbi:MAG: efflux RND transporter periplasmic adaptor subunit [Calditrichota bacterium]